MKSRIRSHSGVTAVLCALLALSACGGGGDTAPAPQPASQPGPSSNPFASPTPARSSSVVTPLSPSPTPAPGAAPARSSNALVEHCKQVAATGICTEAIASIIDLPVNGVDAIPYAGRVDSKGNAVSGGEALPALSFQKASNALAISLASTLGQSVAWTGDAAAMGTVTIDNLPASLQGANSLAPDAIIPYGQRAFTYVTAAGNLFTVLADKLNNAQGALVGQDICFGVGTDAGVRLVCYSIGLADYQVKLLSVYTENQDRTQDTWRTTMQSKTKASVVEGPELLELAPAADSF